MPTLDQDRLQRLLASTVFRSDLWRGTWQDLSPAQRAMAAVGTPGWSRLNSWPILKQSAAADGTTSAAVAAIVDVTGAFSVEWCGVPMIAGAGVDTLLGQVGATGGFLFAWDCINGVFVLTLYNNAGAVARTISTPAASAVVQQASHVVITSTAGGAAGTASIRGIPVVAALGGAGVAANIGANSAVVSGGGGLGMMASLISRASGVAWGMEDRVCLAEAAKQLVGGW